MSHASDIFPRQQSGVYLRFMLCLLKRCAAVATESGFHLALQSLVATSGDQIPYWATDSGAPVASE